MQILFKFFYQYSTRLYNDNNKKWLNLGYYLLFSYVFVLTFMRIEIEGKTEIIHKRIQLEREICR